MINLVLNKNKITKLPGIYLLINRINGKIYVGKTNNLYKRMCQYRNCHNYKEKHYTHILNAIRKYGWENFDIIILELFDLNISNQELLNIESKYIIKFNSTNPDIGYNITKYSKDTTGYKHTEETKNKISKKAIGRYIGDKNPFWGKHHSQESKNKIGAATLDYCGENNPFYGKAHSKKTIEKIRESQKKNPLCNIKRIKKINVKTKEIIKIYNCPTDACIDLFGENISCKKKRIARAASDFKKTSKYKAAFGFYWEYIL